MNTATQNLEQDHVHILRLIDVMERMVRAKSTNIEHFETVVYLIKNYADGFHHAKEENLFFPLLVQKGFSMQQGPVAVMLHEHIQGRNYVSGISEGIALLREGSEKAFSKLYENILGYNSLLRNHIGKENNILFRMADHALSEKDQQDLIEEFSKVENSNLGGGVLQDCLSAIDQLELIYENEK